MIAVCLLTCGRDDLTVRTAHSFEFFNAGLRSDLICLHADCGGHGPHRDVETFGFRTVHAPRERVPQMVSYRALIEEAALKGAEFVLWLENDWESVAPIPTLDWLRKARDEHGIVTWRLFGERKMRGDGPRAMAGEHRIGTKDRVHWIDCLEFEGWQRGHTHWAAGGSIATLAHLESQLHRPRLKDVITAKNDLPTMRPVQNVLFHIGHETTPGFQG